MIFFLLLCYVVLLVILVKLGVIRLTIGWKLSPLFFLAFCIVTLVFPMQWGSPTGTVNVYRYVVEVVPNVSGEVVEVPAQPLQPMKKGDVLFRIDPRPYQIEVDRLEAALKQAEQTAQMLSADVESAKAAVAQARATIAEAKQQSGALGAALDGAEAAVGKANSQFALQRAEFTRANKLFASKVITKAELDAAYRNLEAARSSLDVAKAKYEQAELAFKSRIGGVNTIVIHAEQALRARQAALTKAQLALESTVDGENTAVAQLRSQMEIAKLNLDWTTVRAPADGYVIQLALRPGQRVQNSSMRSWLAFVEQERTRVVVWIKQYQIRYVKPGQEVEIEFKMFPGQTVSAKVDAVVKMNATGQMQATGKLRDPTATPRMQQEYAVILTLDEDSPVDVTDLPGGAIGTAAIYTGRATMTHMIRHVEMNMKSWLNYVIP